MTENILVSEELDDLRIDRYLAEICPDLSRSFIQKLLKSDNVLVNGSAVKPSFIVSAGDSIMLDVPEPVTPEIIPEKMDLDILYEDDDVILVNKPKGMVVHPAPGHLTGTLVNGLMYHCKDQLSGINGVMRPGIVHRIDKDTTGVIIACKNDMAHQSLAQQLKDHTITRKYYAIVNGLIKDSEGTIDAPIGRSPSDRKKMCVNEKNGRRAVTHYRVLETFRHYTYIECQLETGRTHQIRVHMDYIHHPVLGDEVYGPMRSPFSLEGQTLHAGVFGFIHPGTGEYMEITAPLPDYFEKILERLRNQ